MPTQPRSNIRAYVHWRNPSVFAGEDIECVITFKNIAPPPPLPASTQQVNGAVQSPIIAREGRYAPSTAHTTASSVAQTRASHTRNTSFASIQHAPAARGHKPALSLNIGRSASRGGHSSAIPRGAVAAQASGVGKGHARSVSIMSLGSEATADRRSPTTIAATRKLARGGHSRSMSLQVTQRLPLATTQSMVALPTRRSSPLFESNTPPALPEGLDAQLPIRPARRKPGVSSAGNTPQMRQASFPGTLPAESAMLQFEFPPRNTSLVTPERPKPARNPSNMHSWQNRPHSPRLLDSGSSTGSTLNPVTRVLSESSTSGTPRSSVDFYSLSNHSDETLTSEVPSQAPGFENAPPPRPVRQSRRDTILGPARPETVMIGYARTTGSFTLDGSLVNNAPFEEIKRKTVQSDGGVVGVEKPKRSSGVFGAFGWGNIGESLGGLLGGNEVSTIAQMKASAGSRSIPLLSTPQSLLFVDITLAPGEGRSYAYRFPLPRGLPPSYKGRAIKVEYSLAVGIQRPDGRNVKYTNVPFRVLGSVSSRGDPLGHDLMAPYVLLQDTGRSNSIATTPGTADLSSLFTSLVPKEKKEAKKGLESFLRYTERLLDSRVDSNGALLSPTAISSPTLSRKSSIFDQAAVNSKEAIDFALMNANISRQYGGDSPSDAQSANRFTIARSGQHVAVLTLVRPAFRLGESITGTIDLTIPPGLPEGQTSVSTYSVHIELQSTEEVDALLAMRSEATIQRVSRRVYASVRENSLFARRLGFSLAIPTTAAPSFETSGVSLAWSLKIEFTTFRPLRGPGAPDTDQGGDQLLEELGRDERGISLIAKERLAAETFEIAVPVRVYGAYSIAEADRQSDPLEV